MRTETISMAMEVLITNAKAVSTTVAVTSLRSCNSFCDSLKCKPHALRTSDRCTVLGFASFQPVWWLMKVDIKRATDSLGSAKGSKTQTVSRKARGRRLAMSNKPTMSLRLSRSFTSMPELSNESLTYCRILLGDKAWRISLLVGVLPRLLPDASSRKGLQAAKGARSQTFLMELTQRLSCLAMLGVLSISTTGRVTFMPCSKVFFMRVPQETGVPKKTCPMGASTSGLKFMASGSCLRDVLYCQSTPFLPLPFSL
mmetsp:Transcript_33412/g.96008  ORF Transcript_33412/g.96008 Transcript_33412/m.96008 type:complete len:256 (-) Transcript_33412:1019-1786(-)